MMLLQSHTLYPLSVDEKTLIRNYKYTGGDSSPFYKYVLSPFAQFCVDTFIPKWVAPNTITLAGLVISVFSLIIVFLTNPELNHTAPRWLHLVVATSIFAYQTLDNMDGKQARRTHASSALGMVFDHGCDAINAGICTVAMCSVFGTGWTAKIFFTYSCSFIPFYLQTWEEYYTGIMVLPEFNGPSEGLFLCVLSGIVAYFVGSESLYKPFTEIPVSYTSYLPSEESFLGRIGFPTPSNRSVNFFIILFFIVFIAVVSTTGLCIYRVIQVIKKNATRNDPNDHHHHDTPREHSIMEALWNLTPFLIFFICSYNYVVYSRVAYPQFPVITSIFFCAAHADLSINVMVSHILHRKLSFIGRTPTFLLAGLCLLTNVGETWFKNQSDANAFESFILLFSASFSVIFLFTIIKHSCSVFAETLEVDIFKLGKGKNE